MKLNLLFCLLALTLCGCEHTLTYKAWHSTEVTHFQPASDPKLQLWERAAPSSDILVVYQELAERTGRERLPFLFSGRVVAVYNVAVRCPHPTIKCAMVASVVELVKMPISIRIAEIGPGLDRRRV